MLKHTIILSLILTILVASTARAQDEPALTEPERSTPIISDLAKDVEFTQHVVDAEADDKLSKRYGRIKKKVAKGAEVARADLETFKEDVMASESARDAWRALLRKAYGITPAALEKECLPLEEITALVAAEHTKRLQEKYPPSMMVTVEKQAVSRYPIVQVGDHVTVHLRSGRQVSGRVNLLAITEAMVGSTTIPIQDLDPRFHHQQAKKNRRIFVQRNYYDKRKAFERKLKKKLSPYVHVTNGYVRYEKRWVPAKELAAMIDYRITDLAERGAENKRKSDERMATLIKNAKLVGLGLLAIVVLVVIVIIIGRKKR